jgi:hypothetical protein
MAGPHLRIAARSSLPNTFLLLSAAGPSTVRPVSRGGGGSRHKQRKLYVYPSTVLSAIIHALSQRMAGATSPLLH